MVKKIKLLFAVLGAVVLVFFDWRMSIGWLIGWLCLLTLAFFREKFYGIIFDDQVFTVKKYVGYIVFVFLILWLPLMLAFVFPQYINPYSVAVTYLIDRLLLFMSGVFTKERNHVAT